jgi:formamidopyrimidine-DNA glycosylase
MPELPEVEVIRQGLTPRVVGGTITAIACSAKKLRAPLPRAELRRWFLHSRITGLRRRGKYLIFVADNGAAMIVHLGMTGKLGIFAAAAPPALHDHLAFTFADGTQMRYNDTRRFGLVRVLPPGRYEGDDPFKALGVEPLGDAFSAAYLRQMARRRLQPVKNFLMDSRMVAGIGNIYANEILFAAGIRPATPIGSLTQAAWERVAAETRRVLTRAIASGGSSISDFVDSSGRKGYFQLELKVYGRAGEKCPRCGAVITRQLIAGRSSFFCPGCQK